MAATGGDSPVAASSGEAWRDAASSTPVLSISPTEEVTSPTSRDGAAVDADGVEGKLHIPNQHRRRSSLAARARHTFKKRVSAADTRLSPGEELKRMVLDINSLVAQFRESLLPVGQPYNNTDGKELRDKIKKLRRKILEQCRLAKSKVAMAKNQENDEYNRLIAAMELLVVELRKCHKLLLAFPMEPEDSQVVVNGEANRQHPSLETIYVDGSPGLCANEELLRLGRETEEVEKILDELHNQVAIPDYFLDKEPPGATTSTPGLSASGSKKDLASVSRGRGSNLSNTVSGAQSVGGATDRASSGRLGSMLGSRHGSKAGAGSRKKRRSVFHCCSCSMAVDDENEVNR